MKKKWLYLVILALFAASSCRDDDEIIEPEITNPSVPEYISIEGFYLLNEGNMGSNKSTLDYYEYETGTYYRNIFASANPTVVKEMGDVGNDLKIYGDKLYAVINCSNKIDVLDKWTAKKVGQIDIPNCRYIRFHEGYAYVSSYAGPVKIDPDYEQRGYIAKIDTATLKIVGTCLVGFQPDDLEVVGNKIYVANSGGYAFPNYENTISVIDIETFTEIKRIEVGINLHRLRADNHGKLWATSRGDRYFVPSRLYCIDTKSDQVLDTLNIAVSNFHLDGDSLYIYSDEWSNVSMQNEISYGIIDVVKKERITQNFITDGTEKKIRAPYGITVNPITKDIYVTDAKSYVSSGTLYCFDKEGKLKWSAITGDVPAHFAFLGKVAPENTPL